MNRTPENSKNILARNQELLNLKRKSIRSEARNQNRGKSNEAYTFKSFMHHSEENKNEHSNTVEKKPLQLNKRFCINFTFRENKENPKDHHQISTNSTDWSGKQNEAESNSNLRKSIRIESISDTMLDGTYFTYRLPSISPNSKLPSWFLNNWSKTRWAKLK